MLIMADICLPPIDAYYAIIYDDGMMLMPFSLPFRDVDIFFRRDAIYCIADIELISPRRLPLRAAYAMMPFRQHYAFFYYSHYATLITPLT